MTSLSYSVRDGGRWAQLTVGCMLGLLAGGLGALIVHDPNVWLTVVLAIVVPLPIVVRLVQKKFDPFEPIQVLSLSFIILFVVRPIAELVVPITQFRGLDLRAGFTGAALISLIGISCLYVGYAVGFGKRIAGWLRPLPEMWDTARSVRFAGGLLVLSALLTLMLGATIGFATLVHFYLGRTTTDYQAFLQTSGYVFYGPYLTIPASFILLFAWFRRKTLMTGVLLVITIIIALYITVPRGDRTMILAFILPLIALWFLRRGTRPRAGVTLLVLLAAIFGMNILLTTRHADIRAAHGGYGGTVLNSLTHPTSQLGDFATGVDLAEFSVLELEYQAANRDAAPLQFHPGTTFSSLILGPLPRKIIGKIKPKSPLQYVTEYLFPGFQRRASFGPSMFGDMYADYGWLTVVFWSFVIGIGVRVLWEYFSLYSRSQGIQIVFAASLPALVMMTRNNLTDTIARSVFLILPLIACLIVASRPAMRRMAGYRAPPSSSGATPASTASQ